MKSTIKAIIVDDEPACISNLQYNLAAYCPDVQIVGTGSSLKEMSSLISETKIDVAFLDVELFDDNIFNQLGSLNSSELKIVFVTAYDKYAIEAFKVEALDYILKPLSKEDIIACYQKIKKWTVTSGNMHDADYEPANKKKEPTIALRQGDKVYIVSMLNVLYLEAKGFYTKVCFMDNGVRKEILVSKILNKAEREYSMEYFFRVHKSYVVNVHNLKNMLKQGGLSLEMKTGDIIPVAKRRANEFIAYIQTYS